MDQKIRGLLSYLFGWIGGLVVLLAFKDNTQETNKNACQAIVLSAIYIIITIIVNLLNTILTVIANIADVTALKIIFGLIFGFVGFILAVAYIALAIFGMVKAYQEKEYNLPLITPLTKKIFKSKLA